MPIVIQMTNDLQEIQIPTWLFRKIERRMPKDQYQSVSDYVSFVLAQVVSEQEKDHLASSLTPEEEEKIKDRLRALGYL